MVCQSCRQTSHLRLRRVLHDHVPLPPVLVINAGVRTSDEMEVWLDGRKGGAEGKFLEERFNILRRGDAVQIGAGDGEGVTYELRVRFRLPRASLLRTLQRI